MRGAKLGPHGFELLSNGLFRLEIKVNELVEQQEIKPIPLKWFNFRQNNSGGRFIVNEYMAHDVFIQATSAAEAVRRAQVIGLDPYEAYCSCCGERWGLDCLGDEDGFAQPTKYGKLYSKNTSRGFKEEARLHYIDGHIEVAYPGKESQVRLR